MGRSLGGLANKGIREGGESCPELNRYAAVSHWDSIFTGTSSGAEAGEYVELRMSLVTLH